jgi:hypothetical protein
MNTVAAKKSEYEMYGLYSYMMFYGFSFMKQASENSFAFIIPVLSASIDKNASC